MTDVLSVLIERLEVEVCIDIEGTGVKRFIGPPEYG